MWILLAGDIDSARLRLKEGQTTRKKQILRQPIWLEGQKSIENLIGKHIFSLFASLTKPTIDW